MFDKIINNFTIILKISEKCNLACPDCYFFFHGDESHLRRPVIIREDVVHGVGRFLMEAAREQGLRKVVIGFHGGEPLLIKKEFFAEICKLLKHYSNIVQLELKLNIQTNGTLIDNEWIDIFSEEDVQVGISLDGPKFHNDRTRPKVNGKSSYDDTLRGWSLIQKAVSEKRIKPSGILGVASPYLDGGETYGHFRDVFGATSVNFVLPAYCHDTHPGADYIDGVRYFMMGVYLEWKKRKDYGIRLRFVNSIMRHILLETADEERMFISDVRNQISISSDGEIGPEDVLRSTHSDFRNSGIYIQNSNLKEIFAHPMWLSFGDGMTKIPDDCMPCKWKNVCRGGRPWHRFSFENKFNNKSLYCDFFYQINELIFSDLLKSGADIAKLNSNIGYL
ncbi:MAG: radical SAM protein [Methanobacterium sp.]|nr:radical SAM protein [Methanobacterium sp.]